MILTYSHTNWIENGNTEINAALGDPAETANIGTVATIDDPTCIDCDQNTLVNHIITRFLLNYMGKKLIFIYSCNKCYCISSWRFILIIWMQIAVKYIVLGEFPVNPFWPVIYPGWNLPDQDVRRTFHPWPGCPADISSLTRMSGGHFIPDQDIRWTFYPRPGCLTHTLFLSIWCPANILLYM